MGALTERKTACKTTWANLSTRARLGEIFGWIDCVSVLYANGCFVDREAALEAMFKRATAEDIREYRRVKQIEPLEDRCCV